MAKGQLGGSSSTSSLQRVADGGDGGAEPYSRKRRGIYYKLKDVNGDGLKDLVLRFDTKDTGLTRESTSLTLRGEFAAGGSFEVEQEVDIRGRGRGRRR
jgi:hypothetical protein